MFSLKSWSRFGLAIALSAGVGLSASAGMLSTSNSLNDGDSAGGSGTFFDLTASTNLSLTQFDVFSFEDNEPDDFQIDVYYRNGSYVGHQDIAGDWTLLQSFTQAPNGVDVVDELVLTTQLAMSNGDTFGFYVVAMIGGLQWDDESELMTNSNADLTITVHDSTIVDPTSGSLIEKVPNGTYALFDETDEFRQFHGTVHYKTAQVPEPATLALLGLGLLGLGFSRRHRQA